MTWKISACLLLLFCFFSCKNEKDKTPLISFGESNLITVAQLLEHKASPQLKIIDFRKKTNYLEGHIPNAIQIWRSDIEDTSFPYKGMMASRTQIEQLFSKLGIKSRDTLVIYDDMASCDAARLWWVLKCYGFDQVTLLDGGIKAWLAANEPLSKTHPNYEKTAFKLPLTRGLKYHIDRQNLSNLLKDSLPVFVLDTRTSDEYSGKRQKPGATKGGRIPNSELFDWSQAVDLNGSQKFKSIPELKTLYGKLNIQEDANIITYCHSGVRSAHTTFVLTELLGYENVRNYDGSWSEWSHFDEMPFEKDSITVILH